MREILLELLSQHQPVSIWKLAELSQLGIGNVTAILHPLIKSGQLIETSRMFDVPQYALAPDLNHNINPNEPLQQASLDL